MLLGFGLFVTAANGIVAARLAPQYAGDSLLTTVRVVGFPKVSGKTVTMLVEPLADKRLPTRSRVSWHEPHIMPAAGDIWQFEMRLRRPRGSSNPGGFDYAGWALREKLHASGYIVSSKRNRLLKVAQGSIIDRFRRDFVALAQIETNNADEAAVLSAIGVGARHLISREQWDRYALTGTSHLMAISGLHVGLVAAVALAGFAMLAGMLRFPGNQLQQAMSAAVGLALLYGAVSGFAVPALRAISMLILGTVALLLQRPVLPFRTTAAVATGVVLFDPVATMRPGFLLSFSAVVLLIWTGRRYGGVKKNGWLGRMRNAIRQLFTLQIALLLGLMPLTILLFDRIAFLAPFANMLAVPVFSFVTVPATLAAMLLRFVSEFSASLLLNGALQSVAVVEYGIRRMSGLPGADIDLPEMDSAARLLIFVPLLWVLLPRGWPGRWLGILAVAAIVSYVPQKPALSCFEATVLDVGQGLSVVVRTRSHTMVYDTGPSYRTGGSAAQQVVLPFLRSKAITQIDWLILSHLDNDHAGGLAVMAEHLQINQVRSAEQLSYPGLDVVSCRSGQAHQLDGITFRILHPPPGSSLPGNDGSCVLAVTAGAYSMLLTGDIEKAGERALLDNGAALSSTIALIPHHGSLTSSSPALVNSVAAKLAIVSAGYKNHWGFPKGRVVRRWSGTGAQILNTAISGGISLTVCTNGGIRQIREQRREHFRFWHDSAGL